MKQLEDMTEPELRKLTNTICNNIKDNVPKNTGFCILFWPFGKHGIAQYGSNGNRQDMIKALRECADRLERNQDTQR